MHSPSIRTVAVAAGFLGVSMIVAGAASAMSSSGSTGPVATGIRLAQEDPSPSGVPDDIANAIAQGGSGQAEPAVPVEVDSHPIRCTDDGECAAGSAPSETDAAAEDQSDKPATSSDDADASKDEPAPAASQCTWPEKPAKPARDEWDNAAGKQWWDAMREWAKEWQAEAKACGWEPPAFDHGERAGRHHPQPGEGHWQDKVDGWKNHEGWKDHDSDAKSDKGDWPQTKEEWTDAHREFVSQWKQDHDS